mmetsp:Transcript_131047/g.261442  ORF Transcript_131047/g.261442 Transcript_131047/m.261442 type:complete len:97 (+) Transcript_131047:138-428(+)
MARKLPHRLTPSRGALLSATADDVPCSQPPLRKVQIHTKSKASLDPVRTGLLNRNPPSLRNTKNRTSSLHNAMPNRTSKDPLQVTAVELHRPCQRT